MGYLDPNKNSNVTRWEVSSCSQTMVSTSDANQHIVSVYSCVQHVKFSNLEHGLNHS